MQADRSHNVKPQTGQWNFSETQAWNCTTKQEATWQGTCSRMYFLPTHCRLERWRRIKSWWVPGPKPSLSQMKKLMPKEEGQLPNETGQGLKAQAHNHTPSFIPETQSSMFSLKFVANWFGGKVCLFRVFACPTLSECQMFCNRNITLMSAC